MTFQKKEPSVHEQLKLFGFEKYVGANPERADDAVIAHAAISDEGKEITFLHRGFCSAGLPLRNPRGSSSNHVWSKTDGDFTLSISGSSFYIDEDKGPFYSGIPFGPKARLIAMYITEQIHDIRKGNSRDIEFGGITNWLNSAGVTVSGGPRGSIASTKEQLVRFLFAQFTMVMRGRHSDKEQIWFQSEKLIEQGIFQTDDLQNFMDEKYTSISWPERITLTPNTYERFRKNSVPISATRLRTISNNAAAIDLFAWLSYRLPKIPKGESVHVPWDALLRQFGDSHHKSVFMRRHYSALKAALLAYPEARVDETREGLLLHHSDPAIPRKTQVAVKVA